MITIADLLEELPPLWDTFSQWLEEFPNDTLVSDVYAKLESPNCFFWVLNKLKIKLSYELDLRLQVEFMYTPIVNKIIVYDLLRDKRSKKFLALKESRLAGNYITDDEWNEALEEATELAKQSTPETYSGLHAWRYACEAVSSIDAAYVSEVTLLAVGAWARWSGGKTEDMLAETSPGSWQMRIIRRYIPYETLESCYR